MVATGKRLQRAQPRTRRLQQRRRGGGRDVGGGRMPDHPLPTERGAIEPVGDLDSSARATSVLDHRRAGGGVEVTYWLYRPALGWQRVIRHATAADVAATASTPLLEAASPRLGPLETLAGRDHYDFPAAEEPPWRWQVPSVYPG